MEHKAARRAARAAIGLLFLVGAAMALSACQPTTTCTTNWVGPTDGSFATPANWSKNAVPVAADIACAGPTITIRVDDTRSVGTVRAEGTLVVESGARLDLTGPRTVGSTIGQLTLRGTIAGATSVKASYAALNGGDLADSIVVTADTVTETVNGLVLGGSSALVTSSMTVDGTLRMCGDTILHNHGTITGVAEAEITTAGCGTVGAPKIVNTADATFRVSSATFAGVPFYNEGTLAIDSVFSTPRVVQSVGGTTNLSGYANAFGLTAGSFPFELNGGRITGSGRLYADVTGVGTIAPGDPEAEGSLGTLTLHSWTPASGGSLDVDVEAAELGAGADRVAADSADVRNGAITVAVRGGSTFTTGETRELVGTTSGLTGPWASATLPTLAGVHWSDAGFTPTAYRLKADDCAAGSFGPGIDRSGADLSGAFLSGCDLSGTILSGADLSGADLSGATLSEVDLTNADLTNADLSDATMSEANVSGADLTDADLIGATLSEVDLTNADLSGADLGGAALADSDLTDALVVGATTTGATWDDVVCPDGVASGTVGGTCEGHLLRMRTFTVTTTADLNDADPGDGRCDTGTGECSLRAAVEEVGVWPGAQPGTVVLADNATYLLTRTGAGEDASHDGDLDVLQGVHIVGNGSTVQGSFADRMIHVLDGTLEIDDLTINGGWANGVGAGADGGGIWFAAGTAGDLDDVTILGNIADHDGGGIWAGAGVHLDLTGGSLSNNVAAKAGGGLRAGVNGSIDILRSVVANNRSLCTGCTSGQEWGGAIAAQSALTIVDSTLSGNSTTQGSGSAIYVEQPSLTMRNTTVSGNSGIDTIRTWSGVTTVLDHVTITDNTSTSAALFAPAAVSMTVRDSIVADQAAGADCGGGFVPTSDHNVQSAASCGFAGTGDVSGDPKLTPLDDHGGPNATHALAADSPAVDRNTSAGCASVIGADQRGMTRPQGSGCDAGAVEWTVGDPTSSDCSVATITAGSSRVGCDLTGADLRNKSLAGVDFRYANLTGVRFANSSLAGTRFDGATITGADFVQTSDMDSASLATTAVNGWAGVRMLRNLGAPTFARDWYAWDFSGLDLSGADLTNAELHVDLTGANLSGAKLDGFYGARLEGANLSGVTSATSSSLTYLAGADLSGAYLVGANLSHGDVTGATFTGATIHGVILNNTAGVNTVVGLQSTIANGWYDLNIMQTGADFSGWDFRGADLSRSIFGRQSVGGGGVNFTGAQFAGANLTGTWLENADLRNATGFTTATGFVHSSGGYFGIDFRGSDVSFAGATLTNSDFRAANLSAIDFTNATVFNVQWMWATVTGTNFTGVALNADGQFTSTAVNSWEGTNFSGGLTMGNANLTGVNLRNANLTGAYFGYATLTGADFTGATVKNAKFPAAPTLNGAIGFVSTAANSWDGIDLTGMTLDLSGQDLHGVSMVGAMLGRTDVDGGVNFTGANLTGVDLTDAVIGSVDFTNAVGLTAAQLLPTNRLWIRTRLMGTGVTFAGIDLSLHDFTLADLRGVSLAGANLSDASFGQANVAGTDFQGATVTRAYFGGVDLRATLNLKSTVSNDWTGTRFGGANLTGVDLSNTNLTIGSFDGATNFTDANLTGAHLRGNGSFLDATFTGTIWNTTICPDGTVSNNNGGTCVGHIRMLTFAFGSQGGIRASANGTDWLDWTSPTTAELLGSAVGVTGGLYPTTAAVGTNGTVIYARTVDGVFQSRTCGTAHLRDIHQGGFTWVAVGDGGAICSGFDPSGLGGRASGTTARLYGVAHNGGRFVAVGGGGVITTSTNGSSWATTPSGTTNTLNGVTWTGSQFVAVGGNGTVLRSADGLAWTTAGSGVVNVKAVAADSGRIVAVTDNGLFVISTDGGTNWTTIPSGSSNPLQAVIRTSSRWMAVGWSNQVLTSTDGVTWTAGTLDGNDLYPMALASHA